MHKSEQDKSQNNGILSQTRLECGEIVSVIGTGAQGYVAETEEGKAVKILSLEKSDGSINKNAIKELTLNIAMQKAANDYPELRDSLILMDKWDIPQKSINSEDNKNLVFSMPLHDLTKLEGFDFDNSEGELKKDSLMSSFGELLNAFKKLHELGFHADDSNLFVDKKSQKILLSDYDQFSCYSNSKASKYLDESYNELINGFKERNIEKDKLPVFEEMFSKKEDRKISDNLTASDGFYSKNTYDILGMVDSAFGSNYSNEFLSTSYRGAPFSQQVDKLISYVSKNSENIQNKSGLDEKTNQHGR